MLAAGRLYWPWEASKRPSTTAANSIERPTGRLLSLRTAGDRSLADVSEELGITRSAVALAVKTGVRSSACLVRMAFQVVL